MVDAWATKAAEALQEMGLLHAIGDPRTEADTKGETSGGRQTDLGDALDVTKSVQAFIARYGGIGVGVAAAATGLEATAGGGASPGGNPALTVVGVAATALILVTMLLTRNLSQRADVHARAVRAAALFEARGVAAAALIGAMAPRPLPTAAADGAGPGAARDGGGAVHDGLGRHSDNDHDVLEMMLAAADVDRTWVTTPHINSGTITRRSWSDGRGIEVDVNNARIKLDDILVVDEH